MARTTTRWTLDELKAARDKQIAEHLPTMRAMAPDAHAVILGDDCTCWQMRMTHPVTNNAVCSQYGRCADHPEPVII